MKHTLIINEGGTDDVLYVVTLKDEEGCEVTLKRYAGGSIVLKQGSDVLYVSEQLVKALARMLV